MNPRIWPTITRTASSWSSLTRPTGWARAPRPEGARWHTALARRPGKDASLLEELLLLWVFWDEREQPQDTPGPSRRRSATPEQDCILQLSAEPDGQGEQEEPPQA